MADTPREMRRLIAALLSLVVLALLGLVFLTPRGEARAQIARTHTCSATDRQFIETTKLNMTILGYWSQSLVGGDADPHQVVAQARSVTKQIHVTKPTDPSLEQTKTVLEAMLGEYTLAVQAEMRSRPAGQHMMKAYALANSAHDVLQDAQPALTSLGCEVAPLL